MKLAVVFFRRIMAELILGEEYYRITGILMEVHRNLGPGFLEIVYKDAIEYEFRNNGIIYEREKEYDVPYKGIVLKHKFYADFVVSNSVILEIKAIQGLPDIFTAHLINYLKVSGNRLGIIANFYGKSLVTKRYVF